MKTPRTEADRVDAEKRHQEEMFKKGISSQPVTRRARQGSQAIPCLVGLVFYSLLCVGLLLTLAAGDGDHITLNGDTVRGGIEHNAVILTIAADGSDANHSRSASIVDKPATPRPGTVTGYSAAVAPVCIAVGAKCSSRIKALSWAREQGISAEIIAAIEAGADETNIPPSVLLAIGEVESNHNQSCRGDSGRAIGWGQVHRSPWQRWAMKESGRVLSLDILEDNVLISAMVLEYSGYHQDAFTSYARYNGGPAYRSSKAQRYARMVAALVKEIGGAE